MIDGGFQHQKSVSINGFLPENFTWVKGNQESDVEVFIDSAIKLNLNKPKEKKYAWIFESEKIFNIKWILDNVDTVSKSYEYIFTHNSKLLSLGRNFVFVPANSFWVLTPKIHKKDKLVSMIYSNKKQTEGHRKRLEIANKYGKYLDSYGFGINPIKHKEEGLNDYMFSVVVENGKYDDYFTEKILDCFATGTIPVYWGCDCIDKYFDKDGIIKLTDDFDITNLTEEYYYSKIESVKNNFNEVLKYKIIENWLIKYIKKL
jgi:hypothetical protein